MSETLYNVVFDHPEIPTWVIDIFYLYGGDHSLVDLVRTHLKDEYVDLLELEKRLKVHLRASKTAQQDVDPSNPSTYAPSDLCHDLYDSRQGALQSLLELKLQSEPGCIEQYWKTASVQRMYEEISKNGILLNGKLVYTKFNCFGGKTRRIRVRSGFNCHGIPHGKPREAITSRFPGGKIVSFDFNAIDYRCLVASVKDEEFKKLYEDCDDFHKRSVELIVCTNVITPEVRDVVKKATYISLYGGSVDTLSQKTGLSIMTAGSLLARMNKVFAPLHKFRDELTKESRDRGGEDHPGKVLGLYAQTFSSDVFNVAVESLIQNTKGWESKIIFTVHDEIVMDMHPAELHWCPEIASLTGKVARGFKIHFQEGENYGEATV